MDIWTVDCAMQPERSIGADVIEEKAQQLFCEASGDWNPQHCDAIWARRSLPGRQIIHGMHLVLRALDRFLPPGCNRLTGMEARFHLPIGIGQFWHWEMYHKDGEGIQLAVTTDEGIAAMLKCRWQSSQEADDKCLLPTAAPREPVAEMSIEVPGKASSCSLYYSRYELQQLFPNASSCLWPPQLAFLLGLSRVIGMKCPGKNALLASVTLGQSLAGRNVEFCLLNYDERFHAAELAVRGSSLEGTALAFVCPEPRAQASMRTVQNIVPRQSFAGQIALVVGGSRGLGEITGKILAAGGASVVITYCAGKQEGQSLASEVATCGGKLTAAFLDVEAEESQSLRRLCRANAFTHCYYFATPRIFSGSRLRFRNELFAAFCRCYIERCGRLLEFLLLEVPGMQGLFVPSTTAIEDLHDKGWEYAAAKAAMEVWLRSYAARHPRLRISCPRLPRLATDQTAILQGTSGEDPLIALLPVLLNFSGVRGQE